MAGGFIQSHASGGTIYQFITLKGHIQPLAMMVQDVTRPGVDGQAYRQEAKRAEKFKLMGIVDCDDMAAAATLLGVMKGLQGSLVDMKDDYGIVKTNVMMLGVTKTDQIPLITAVGGISTNKGALLTLEFQMQLTA